MNELKAKRRGSGPRRTRRARRRIGGFIMSTLYKLQLGLNFVEEHLKKLQSDLNFVEECSTKLSPNYSMKRGGIYYFLFPLFLCARIFIIQRKMTKSFINFRLHPGSKDIELIHGNITYTGNTIDLHLCQEDLPHIEFPPSEGGSDFKLWVK